jgi:hypothetical protein
MPQVAASKKQHVCFFRWAKILCEANCRCIADRVKKLFSSPYGRVGHDLDVDFEQLAGGSEDGTIKRAGQGELDHLKGTDNTLTERGSVTRRSESLMDSKLGPER